MDPAAIGRMVDIHADLERVRVRAGGRIVADLARVWTRGTTVTDPAHVQTAKLLRQQYQTHRAGNADQGLVRDLADYDRAFGIIDGQVS